jgi:hypothetical protein
MNLMMLKAWILASSVSLQFFARPKRNSRVSFKSIGSLDSGSALSIAKIVGGIPADLLKTVEWSSVWICSKA